jgi:predicted nuclease of predicted toxin-antitoxin system
LKIIIDMNLAPRWVDVLSAAGHDAKHWSSIGLWTATDREIMEVSRTTGSIVLTHDLDFSAILAATGLDGPSVVQVRTLDPSPESLGSMVIAALLQFKDALANGAIVVVEPDRVRARLLPLR